MKLKVFTAFSGYDSQCLALDRLKEYDANFDYELVGWSEIDKYAIQAHNALYPQYADRNYGDISKIDWHEVPDFDLFTYSFPCTDISNAGQQKGLSKDSGTRSSLLWECQRAIEIKRPKYLLMENVFALVSEKFMPYFNEWQLLVARYGYSNYTQVMNAKDCGVPQNRERVFMVSILDADAPYYFPEPFPLELRLKDILETNVDEKYYLSDKMLSYFTKVSTDKSHGHNFTVKGDDDIAFTITTAPGNRVDDNYIKSMNSTETSVEKGKFGGCPKVKQVGNIYPDTEKFKNRTMGRIYDAGGISPTINCCGGGDREPKIIDDTYANRDVREYEEFAPTLRSERSGLKVSEHYRIRKLTPRECFRLMGVDEINIDKIQAAGISNTQQYKLAGNSIVVDNLYHIFRTLFSDTKPQENTQLTLF